MITNYGIDNWYKLIIYSNSNAAYNKLKLLSKQYNPYIGLNIKARLTTVNLIKQKMPYITNLMENGSPNIYKDKLNSFV